MRCDWNGKDWYQQSHEGNLSFNFFNRFISTLLKQLPSDWNVVYRAWQNPGKDIDLRNIHSKTVLLLWGERASKKPPSWLQVPAITLKPFCPETWVSKKIIPFPNEFFYDNSSPEYGTRPIKNRKIDVFFSGNLNRRRLDFYRGVTGWLKHYPKIAACYPQNGRDPFFQKIESHFFSRICQKNHPSLNTNQFPSSRNLKISFTDGFGKGLPWQEYWEILLDTKILICPPGFMSTETIRHIEGAKAGCIILTGKLPPFPFYQGAPFVNVNDWRQIYAIIHNLLAMPDDDLNELGRKHLDFFRNKLNPEALAEYVLRHLFQR